MKLSSLRCARFISLTVLPVLLFCVGGCQTHTEVAPFIGRSVVALEADDVVLIMRKAGFSDEDIREHGVALRNGLATQGGARIEKDNLTTAVFIAKGREVHVYTYGGTSFVYTLPTHSGESPPN